MPSLWTFQNLLYKAPPVCAMWWPTRFKDCMKPRHNPAKCALCGEDHPANYKGCIVYKNLVATRSNPTRVNNPYHQHQAIYPNQQRPITTPQRATHNPSTSTPLIQTFLSKTVTTHMHRQQKTIRPLY